MVIHIMAIIDKTLATRCLYVPKEVCRLDWWDPHRYALSECRAERDGQAPTKAAPPSCEATPCHTPSTIWRTLLVITPRGSEDDKVTTRPPSLSGWIRSGDVDMDGV